MLLNSGLSTKSFEKVGGNQVIIVRKNCTRNTHEKNTALQKNARHFGSIQPLLSAQLNQDSRETCWSRVMHPKFPNLDDLCLILVLLHCRNAEIKKK